MSNVAAKVVIISIQSMKVKLFSKRSNQSMICSSQHSQKEENKRLRFLFSHNFAPISPLKTLKPQYVVQRIIKYCTCCLLLQILLCAWTFLTSAQVTTNTVPLSSYRWPFSMLERTLTNHKTFMDLTENKHVER